MSKVKAAIIGIGGYAQISLDNIFEETDKGRNDFEIVAFVDPYPEVSKHYERLRNMNIPYFADIDSMYASGISPELCLISTPIQFHTQQMLTCLKNGSSVICEKPMTGNAEDIDILAKAEKESGKFIAIGYQWSYSDAIQLLKKDIMNGVYGKAVNMKTLVMCRETKLISREVQAGQARFMPPTAKRFWTAMLTMLRLTISTTYFMFWVTALMLQ